jgi:quercetin dioxygenase-like cupin family protein
MATKKPRRFVTRKEMKVERLPWGPHDWLCRPDIVAAEKLLTVRVHMPKGKGHGYHKHPSMEEVIYVLEGKAEQWVDGEMQILKPGEIAHIPPNVVHATYNAGQKVLRFLAILSPARARGPALVDMTTDDAWSSRRRDGKSGKKTTRKAPKKTARKTTRKTSLKTSRARRS